MNRSGGRWRWAALGGIVGPAAFIGAWALLGARRPGYDPVTDHISRLAAAGVAERPAMTAGFVAFGLGMPVYSLALRRSLPGWSWATAATTGLATLGVAAFPLDGPAGDGAHAVAAGVGYATLAATPLLAAGGLRRAGHSAAARVSALTGVVSGACLLATVVGPATGLFQRLGLTVGDAWIVTSAVVILRAGPCRPRGAGAMHEGDD